MRRRGFLAGLALLAAPAIIRTPGILMPVKAPPRVSLTQMRDLLLPGLQDIGRRYTGYAPLKVEGQAVPFDPQRRAYDLARIRDLLLPGLCGIEGKYPNPHGWMLDLQPSGGDMWMVAYTKQGDVAGCSLFTEEIEKNRANPWRHDNQTGFDLGPAMVEKARQLMEQPRTLAVDIGVTRQLPWSDPT